MTQFGRIKLKLGREEPTTFRTILGSYDFGTVDQRLRRPTRSTLFKCLEELSENQQRWISGHETVRCLCKHFLVIARIVVTVYARTPLIFAQSFASSSQ